MGTQSSAWAFFKQVELWCNECEMPTSWLIFHDDGVMPTISVPKDELYRLLERTYTTAEFDELMFAYGLELDEDTSETNPTELPHKLKVEVPANRYDLLCLEGLARALRIYLGLEPAPKYKVLPWAGRTATVAKECAQIRPFFGAAILRGIKFDQAKYDSFIDLQDKLHMNLARKRTLVAIGTHDLSRIADGPLSYEALPPKEIKFAPLNKDKVYDASEMMELYENDRHLSKFLHIIKDSPVYPILYDSTRQVLSMPPIINSDFTKITLDTTDVFVDVTATDETKLKIVLEIIVTMFAQYTTPEPFTVEPVKIVYQDSGREVVVPELKEVAMDCSVDYINAFTALSLSPEEVCKLLNKMGNGAVPDPANPNLIKVAIPPNRPDILHPCDLVEDAAIAYGFDNLVKTFPRTNTVAQPLPINKLSDQIRRECASSGWVEALPLILCSHDESFAWLNRKDDGKTAVVLANPKTAEYQIVRTTLLAGLLKTVRENKKHALPLRLFEVSDVAVKDPSTERRARNIRRVSAVYVGKKAGFEQVHGLLDRLMLILGVKRISESSNEDFGYYIKGVDDPTYFPDRSAKIYLRQGGKDAQQATLVDQTFQSPPNDPLPEGVAAQVPKASKAKVAEKLKTALTPSSTTDIELGTFGILHPTVLEKFEVDGFALSAIEFDLEPFL